MITAYYSNKKKKVNTCLCHKILIVDDNEYNIYALETMLKMRGYMSDCTNNGKTAVKMIKEKWENKKCSDKCPGYQLVFMDCSMPIMDGFEATQIIRKF